MLNNAMIGRAYQPGKPAAPFCNRGERRMELEYTADVMAVQPIGNLYLNGLSTTSVSGFTDVDLAPQQKVLISLGDSDYRSITVASVTDGVLIATFDQALASDFIHAGFHGTAIVPRLALIGSAVSATVRNRSRTGAMIETELPLVVGQNIIFSLTDGAPVIAQVRWTDGGKAGLFIRAHDKCFDLSRQMLPFRAKGSGASDTPTPSEQPFVDFQPQEIAPPRRTGRASQADLRQLLHVGAFRIGAAHFCMRFTPYVRSQSGGWIGQSKDDVSFESRIIAHIMDANDPFVVPDVNRSELKEEISCLPNAQKARFFCGHALRSSDGLPLGVIFFADRKPRIGGLDLGQRAAISGLAKYVGAQIEKWLDAALAKRHALGKVDVS